MVMLRKCSKDRRRALENALLRGRIHRLQAPRLAGVHVAAKVPSADHTAITIVCGAGVEARLSIRPMSGEKRTCAITYSFVCV